MQLWFFSPWRTSYRSVFASNLFSRSPQRGHGMPRDLKSKLVEELLSTGEPEGKDFERVTMELTRRQTMAQMEAAQATKETAIYAKESVRWMFWSVVALAIASLG